MRLLLLLLLSFLLFCLFVLFVCLSIFPSTCHCFALRNIK
jgi:hypothetical protein